MQKKKENFLEKIVKKDYDNELEEILETKKFEENVKNILLEILYKIEISYKDYEKVKRDTETKEEYITKIIETIEKEIEEIELITPRSQEKGKTKKAIFIIDKENKKIVCSPIERELLYAISKISKQNQIVKEKDQLINDIITNAINEGNSINMVEPLRDFNGWSWLITKKEIENLSYNLIYQNLRILIGNDFLLKWIENKQYIINYYELLKNELEEKYTTEIKDKLIYKLEELFVLIERKTNPEMRQKIKDRIEEVKTNLEKIEDKRTYVEDITNETKRIKSKMRELDTILADKVKIENEFKIRNEILPLEQRIFSIKALVQILNDEKEYLKKEYEEKTDLLKPNKFIEKKEEEEKKYELLENKDIEKTLVQFQEIFLEAFLIKIEKAETKEEMVNLIYDFRYYQMLPFNENMNIYESTELKNRIKEVEEKILGKATKNKVINEIIESTIFHYIFITKIINLEEIYIQVKEDNNKIIIEFSENGNEQYDEKFEIDKEEINEDNIFRSYKDRNRFKLFS